jgi:hypothetical protein
MRSTTKTEIAERVTVDIDGLQAMLSVGRVSAISIAESAGAVIRVGRRRLYNVAKVKRYLDSVSGTTE